MAEPYSQPPSTRPASSEQRPSSDRRTAHSTGAKLAPVICLVAITIVTASIMAFGNPVLWSPWHQAAQPHEKVESIPDEATVISEYQTISQSTDENRAHNLQKAAEALDGIIIMPGQTLSLNEALGDTSTDPEYLEAPIFSGSSIAAERGGGVCQVASAIYVAALCADLQVVERHPHTMACDYVPLGLDATLSYGAKDLKLFNNTSEPMYLSVTAEGQSVRVAVRGIRTSSDTTYNVFSRATGMRVVSGEEAAEELGLSDVPEGSVLTLYDVESYKVRYVDGKAQDTTLVANDAYLVSSEQAGAQSSGQSSEQAGA